MAIKYEFYNTGDDETTSFYGTRWQSQTFTPSISHKITSVKMLIWSGGGPGNVTVSIRATTNDKPSGSDLISKTVDRTTIFIGSPGTWYEFDFGAGVDLLAGTRYAIVARAPDNVFLTSVKWRVDITEPLYADGEKGTSSDSGSTWNMGVEDDLMFEEWGGGAAFPTHAKTRVTGIIHRYFINAPDPRQKYSLTCVLGGISVFSTYAWSKGPSGIDWPWDRWGAVTAPPWAGDPKSGRPVPPWAGDPGFGVPAPSPPWFPSLPSPPPGSEPDIPEPPEEDGWTEI